jgi:hypothetical protein
VEAVVAAQVQEARIPDDLSAVAAGDDRAQVVVDALAWHAAQPLEGAHVPLQERLERHLQREERRLCAPEYGNETTSAYTPALLPAELGTSRHLAPVELQHLARR